MKCYNTECGKCKKDGNCGMFSDVRYCPKYKSEVAMSINCKFCGIDFRNVPNHKCEPKESKPLLTEEQAILLLNNSYIGITPTEYNYVIKNWKNNGYIQHPLSEELLEKARNQIFDVVAKLDNGSHSSSQLQAVDEAIFDIIKQVIEQLKKEMVEK